jgi:hypothetical protein
MTGWAVDVDMSERLLEVEVFKDADGNKQRCYVPCKSDRIVRRRSQETRCSKADHTVQTINWSLLSDLPPTLMGYLDWSIVTSLRSV